MKSPAPKNATTKLPCPIVLDVKQYLVIHLYLECVISHELFTNTKLRISFLTIISRLLLLKAGGFLSLLSCFCSSLPLEFVLVGCKTSTYSHGKNKKTNFKISKRCWLFFIGTRISMLKCLSYYVDAFFFNLASFQPPHPYEV